MKKINKQNGFSLLYAVLVTSIVLYIAGSIVNITLKELILTSSTRDSHKAFYAADAAVECVLYWDIAGGTTGISYFNASDSKTISCFNKSITLTPVTIGDVTTFSFKLDKSSDPVQINVVVTKDENGTTIDSRGYNTSDTTNKRRLERGLEVTY